MIKNIYNMPTSNPNYFQYFLPARGKEWAKDLD